MSGQRPDVRESHEADQAEVLFGGTGEEVLVVAPVSIAVIVATLAYRFNVRVALVALYNVVTPHKHEQTQRIVACYTRAVQPLVALGKHSVEQ